MKTEIINIRIDKETKELLKKKAKADNRTLAGYVLNAAIRYEKGGAVTAAPPIN